MMFVARVEMYVTQTCSWCIRAKRVLAAHGVNSVHEIDVSFDRDAMMERTGGISSVPQIFIGDYHVGGYDGLVELSKSGKLDELLDTV